MSVMSKTQRQTPGSRCKKKKIWFCLVCKTSRCFVFEQPSAALCRANSCASRNPAHYQAFFFPISQSNYLFWGFSPRVFVQRQLQNDCLSDRRRPHVSMTVMSLPPSPPWYRCRVDCAFRHCGPVQQVSFMSNCCKWGCCYVRPGWVSSLGTFASSQQLCPPPIMTLFSVAMMQFFFEVVVPHVWRICMGSSGPPFLS